MNDVTLNSTDLKLARSGEAVPARALSSSSAEGMRVAGSVANQNTTASANGTPGAGKVAQPQALSLADQAAQAKEVKESQKEKLSTAVSQLNSYVQHVQRDLQFEVDSELGQVVVKVVDQKTQQVIRQMPDELALRLAEKLQQDEPLTFFNIKV
jgi:flagellar protein FlaG